MNDSDLQRLVRQHMAAGELFGSACVMARFELGYGDTSLYERRRPEAVLARTHQRLGPGPHHQAEAR